MTFFNRSNSAMLRAGRHGNGVEARCRQPDSTSGLGTSAVFFSLQPKLEAVYSSIMSIRRIRDA
jgi:hypothetical protein